MQFESNESEQLLDAATKYMDQVEKMFPTRAFATAVTDINGKNVFITKYFKALDPPKEVLELPGDQEVIIPLSLYSGRLSSAITVLIL